MIVALFTFAIPLVHPGKSPAVDWDEFNSFSHFTRSSIWSYHTWPLHDPWFCGGHDLWANPQQRVFSPFVLFDILLPANLANLASLVVLAFVGHYLAIRFFEALKVSRGTAVTCATLWILSSWFGLHFSVGHIAYGTIQLLPGIALCALRIDRPLAQVGLAALATLCVVSGGIYAAIFAIYLLLTLLPLYWPRLGIVLRQLRADRATRWRLALLLIVLVAATASRLIPARIVGVRTSPELEWIRPPFRMLMHILFDPDQRVGSAAVPVYKNFGYHELGAYIGVLAIGIVAFLFVRRRAAVDRVAVVGVVGALLWLWVGTGRLPAINPWRLHQSIPILQMAHVQTRLLILAYLLLLIPLARALDAMGGRARLACVVLLLLEASVIDTRLYLYAWDSARPVSWPMMSSTTVERTAARIDRPALYFTKNVASSWCYDASVKWRRAIADSDPRYQGEVWASGAGPDCHPRMTSFTPAGMHVALDGCTTAPYDLSFNTMTLAGFSLESPKLGNTTSRAGETLRVHMNQAVPDVTLHYAPRHRPWVLSLLALAATALFGAFVLARGRFSRA